MLAHSPLSSHSEVQLTLQKWRNHIEAILHWCHVVIVPQRCWRHHSHQSYEFCLRRRCSLAYTVQWLNGNFCQDQPNWHWLVLLRRGAEEGLLHASAHSPEWLFCTDKSAIHASALWSFWISLRASLPVVTAAVAVLVEKKIPSRSECMALILLTMGVCTTLYEGKALGSGAGLVLCCAGELILSSNVHTKSAYIPRPSV